jgi:hypothetical protein
MVALLSHQLKQTPNDGVFLLTKMFVPATSHWWFNGVSHKALPISAIVVSTSLIYDKSHAVLL